MSRSGKSVGDLGGDDAPGAVPNVSMVLAGGNEVRKGRLLSMAMIPALWISRRSSLKPSFGGLYGELMALKREPD